MLGGANETKSVYEPKFNFTQAPKKIVYAYISYTYSLCRYVYIQRERERFYRTYNVYLIDFAVGIVSTYLIGQ